MKLSDKDHETSEEATELPLLPSRLLDQMAEILGVTDSAAVAILGERVEAAMKEYKTNLESAPPPPRELRKTFENLSGSYRDLYETLTQLGTAERGLLDDASLDFHPVRLARDGRFGMDEAMAALRKVGALIRTAKRRLPKVKKGPQSDSARWYLVHRLGMIYARSRPRKQGDPEFEIPTRRYNDYSGKEYGPFLEFVVAAHEALGFVDPERGVDDVIRSVWGGMGKKRRR